MKTLLIFILLIFITLTEKASTDLSGGFSGYKHQAKLHERVIKPFPVKLKLQLHLLQANIKKYDALISIERIKDSITVLKDTAHVK